MPAAREAIAELDGPATEAAIDDAIERADQAMYGMRAASRPAPGGAC